MKVHILRSKDVKAEIYKAVYELLVTSEGPLQFKSCKNSINFRDVTILPWELIFDEMTTFRERNVLAAKNPAR